MTGDRKLGARFVEPQASVASRGFTMLELVVVLVILGVFALIALPRLPAGLFDGTPDLVAAEDQLVGDLRRARSTAMGCGDNKSVLVEVSDGWVVDAATNCLASPLAGPRNLSGVSVAGSDLEFRYPWGRLHNGEDVLLTISGGSADPRRICVFGLTGAIQRGGC
ncbi:MULTISPECIES: prepilin-type N-terminal cleavage/methylation domain-containing protein [unclassified Thioalkalivibrio]|uniref:prepilin-type N-terminal cleavage/methylation domain-containing protein n=1 Tax=unclassified Thioalkalivibrio TaxID=2621013 RepID=UPI00037B1D20|nr:MULTISPECIES: prepilin-type N-terminal cleavage/methylation domain-containing protein [unclassified Thioalkalivibrio]